VLNLVGNSTGNVAQDKFCVVPKPVSYCSLDPDSWALVAMSAGKSKSELKAKGPQTSVLETEGHQNQTVQIVDGATRKPISFHTEKSAWHLIISRKAS